MNKFFILSLILFSITTVVEIPVSHAYLDGEGAIDSCVQQIDSEKSYHVIDNFACHEEKDVVIENLCESSIVTDRYGEYYGESVGSHTNSCPLAVSLANRILIEDKENPFAKYVNNPCSVTSENEFINILPLIRGETHINLTYDFLSDERGTSVDGSCIEASREYCAEIYCPENVWADRCPEICAENYEPGDAEGCDPEFDHLCIEAYCDDYCFFDDWAADSYCQDYCVDFIDTEGCAGFANYHANPGTWVYEHFCYQSMAEKSSDGDYLNRYEINPICDPLKAGCNVDCINTRLDCEYCDANCINSPPDAPQGACPDHCKVTKNLNLKYCPVECKSTEHMFYGTDDGKSQKQTCDPLICNIKCNNQIPGCVGLDPEATGSNCLPQKCKVTTASIVGKTCPQGEKKGENCVKVEEEKPVQLTAVGCPGIDGNTCEITKEIDVDFDWKPSAIVELKCRYNSPTWPFELDLEGIAKPGCNHDTSKCGRPVTPIFNNDYLFSIGGPEIGVTPSKPGSIRIAGFDFSSLKDKNIKLCIQHPDCYVDWFDNDFGDAEDVGCDKNTESISSALDNGIEQQQSALSTPTCNIGLFLGNKYSADTGKKQIFQANDPCARNIIPKPEQELINSENTGWPVGFKFMDAGGFGGNVMPKITVAEVHVNGKFLASFCSNNAPRSILNDLDSQYNLTKEDKKSGYCYPGVNLNQNGKDVELKITNAVVQDGFDFYNNMFPQIKSRAGIWMSWINDEIEKLFTSNTIYECLRNANQFKGQGLIYLLEQKKCYGSFVDNWNKFVHACSDNNYSPNKQCNNPFSPGYNPSVKDYRFIFHVNDRPLRVMAETTLSLPEHVVNDIMITGHVNETDPVGSLYDWNEIVGKNKEVLASMAFERLTRSAAGICGSVCCQFDGNERASCINGCKYKNVCENFPGDFLAVMAGGKNAKVYTDMCLKYLKTTYTSTYDVPVSMNQTAKAKDPILCVPPRSKTVLDSAADQDLWRRFLQLPVNVDLQKEMQKSFGAPKTGPNPASSLITDPSPIDAMQNLIRPRP